MLSEGACCIATSILQRATNAALSRSQTPVRTTVLYMLKILLRQRSRSAGRLCLRTRSPRINDLNLRVARNRRAAVRVRRRVGGQALARLRLRCGWPCSLRQSIHWRKLRGLRHRRIYQPCTHRGRSNFIRTCLGCTPRQLRHYYNDRGYRARRRSSITAPVDRVAATRRRDAVSDHRQRSATSQIVFCWSYVVPEIHVSYFTPHSLELAYERVGLTVLRGGYGRGWSDIIRFKVLKNLHIKSRSAVELAFPWSLLSRVLDRRFSVTAHPLAIKS